MTQLEIEVLPALSDNYVYLLRDSDSGMTAVVDPAEAEPVLQHLADSGRELAWIMTTHHHFDHTGGNIALKKETGCRIVGPAAERDRIPGIDVALAEGETFELGESVAEVFDTPGHTAGHISFWFEEAGALFSADALFSLGCGRLFEGTAEQMWGSLQKLRALPDETKVYCGHEYTESNARFALTIDPDNEALKTRAKEVTELRRAGKATIPSILGDEKAANPFLRPDDAAIRRTLDMEGAGNAAVFAEIRRRKDAG